MAIVVEPAGWVAQPMELAEASSGSGAGARERVVGSGPARAT
jgi:hypothetical protein